MSNLKSEIRNSLLPGIPLDPKEMPFEYEDKHLIYIQQKNLRSHPGIRDLRRFGGEGGIRTPGTVSRTTV